MALNLGVIGALLGVIARTLVPYLVRLQKDPDLVFDRKYIVSAVSGLILSLIASMFIIGEIDPNIGLYVGFMEGWALQDMSREAQKILGPRNGASG